MITVGRWQKSSRSQGNSNCVEVGATAGLVMVRDTKDRASGAILVSTAAAWNTFLGGVKAGEFDAS